MNPSGLFFQSLGKPSRFSKTVRMPVAEKRATASSVYLSKSVSKAQLPAKDVRLKEKLQSLLRIEPGARRLNLKNGTQGRHVNAKLVGSGQQLGTR